MLNTHLFKNIMYKLSLIIRFYSFYYRRAPLNRLYFKLAIAPGAISGTLYICLLFNNIVIYLFTYFLEEE